MITARTALIGAEYLADQEIQRVLEDLALWIDGYPRAVFLRDDLVAKLTELVNDAEIRQRHDRRW